RGGISLGLACLFTVNWIETAREGRLTPPARALTTGDGLVQAFHWFEGGLSFERHDLTSAFAVYAASLAYFFLPVGLLAVTIAVLWRRPAVDAYRIFGLSITATYVLSLGFFLFLPVPERWAVPDSQAMLLSDLWSTKLIE